MCAVTACDSVCLYLAPYAIPTCSR